MSYRLRILTLANVSDDPNSGAGGTVVRTNESLRELGHDVVDLYCSDLHVDGFSTAIYMRCWSNRGFIAMLCVES